MTSTTRRARQTRAKGARPTPDLLAEIATTRDGRDITQPYVRGLREARDPKLSTAVDWGAYDVVFNDDQVFSTMQQRIGAVVSRDWNVLAGDEDDPRSVKAAEAFDATMKRLAWDRTTRRMLMATFYGYSVGELIWGYRDGLLDIIDIKVRHARRFRYDAEDALRMLVPGKTQGELLPERKFWVHAVGAADDDQPYGMGLAHWLYWPTLFKRNGIRFWNVFLDKYGTPTAKGTYPRGSSSAEINKLLIALQAIATDSGFVVPEGMTVELLSAAKSGTADFHQLCAYMDGAIAKVVLSQTMTTDNGSSRAQGQVHAEVKLEVVKTDADDLTDSFTGGPARWWTDFNFGTDVAAPIVRRIVEEEEDTKANAETDEIHARNGWVRNVDSFRDTYGEGYVRRDDPEAPAGSQTPAPGAPGSPPGDASGQHAHDDDPDPDGASGADPAAKTPAPNVSFAADDPRPLYVSRRLLNAGELLDWAHSQGFASTTPAEKLHVTVAYSRQPVNWFAMGGYGSNTGELLVPPGGPRLVERLGEDGAVALLFQSVDLQWRHREMRDAGASWDHPSYLPHVTLTYEPGDLDLAGVEPYQGRLVFGPERFEALQSDWQASFAEAADDHDSDDHDDSDSVVDRMIAEEGLRVAAAMTGTLIERIMAAGSEAEARALLATGLGTMDEAPLMQALERAGFAAQLDAAAQPARTEEDV